MAKVTRLPKQGDFIIKIDRRAGNVETESTFDICITVAFGYIAACPDLTKISILARNHKPVMIWAPSTGWEYYGG
jgi:hypothetical protein